MTDRAHNAKTHEVRAMLAGRMSQTRRLLKPQPEAGWRLDPRRAMAAAEGHFWFTDDPGFPGNHLIRARYAPGDRLWIQETWSHTGQGVWTIEAARRRINGHPTYKADAGLEHGSTSWWAATSMPREFSRLTLIVTDVRAQRIQDISEADAIAEGVTPRPGGCALSSFLATWQMIHGAGSWTTNPWVAAVSFKTIRANIDSAEAKAA